MSEIVRRREVRSLFYVRYKGGGVPGVFLQMDLLNPCPTVGVLTDHFVKNIEEMFGDSFTGRLFDFSNFKEPGLSKFSNFFDSWVGITNNGSMIEMFINPISKVM